VFFAFIITTDSLTSELRDAYIKEPATTALLLVIPYRAARDDAARPRDG
jgi:hypothetical protein